MSVRRSSILAAAGLALVAVVLAACTHHNTARTAPSASATPSVPASPLAQHKTGDAFTVGPWRLTVTGVVRDRTDTSTGENQNVDAVEVTYTNISTGPADFTAADVTGSPNTLGFIYALGADGAMYNFGWLWSNATVNPHVSGTNELVFVVTPGTKLTSVIIGSDSVTL